MASRRAVLSVVAGGILALAGCGGPSEGTEPEFGLTTTGVEGVPGQAVGADVTARGVGVITYRVDALPVPWQVTQGDFGPKPTEVRESYPPELVWDPSVGSVDGTFMIAIPDGAPGGDYSLPIEARAGDSDETAVSTAVITVDGPTETPSPQPTGTTTSQEPTESSAPQASTASPPPERTD